ncbi:hypothetical protein JJC00_35350 [Bradyrhizobium diazoefficiens]|uniref:hypothetical protein n=1 Tax=Bradyrhizobium diazoefficiens TaxID=1355477 RepID=UPI0019097737|nr:hypothetical protein [Bradyrhizobium diazoefficiens]QQO33715.1 hypothetical protein JJC00_35350 [Bradyrhizobium diazoefficiens]
MGQHVNLKKAKAMEITVPHPLLGRADDVITRHCNAAARESASGPLLTRKAELALSGFKGRTDAACFADYPLHQCTP